MKQYMKLLSVLALGLAMGSCVDAVSYTHLRAHET